MRRLAQTDEPEIRDGTVSISDFLQSRIHKAFTTVADDLCSMGFLSTETRIDVSGAIGDVLELFREKMAELGIDEMELDNRFARDLIMKYASAADMVGDTLDTITVVIVDGERVRNELDIYFTAGGHHWQYDFIPENEIWIDDLMPEPLDMIASLVHELIERALMKHLNYYNDPAHELASVGAEALRTDWAEHETPDGSNGFHHNKVEDDDWDMTDEQVKRAAFVGNEVVPALRDAAENAANNGEWVHDKTSALEALRLFGSDESVIRYVAETEAEHVQGWLDVYVRSAQQLPGTYAPLAEEEIEGTGKIGAEDEENEVDEKESGKSYDPLRSIVEAKTKTRPKTGIWYYYNYEFHTKFGDPAKLPSHAEWMDSEGVKVVGVDFDRIPRGSVYFFGAYTAEGRPMVDLVANAPGQYLSNDMYDRIAEAFDLQGAQITEENYQEAYGRSAMTMEAAIQLVAQSTEADPYGPPSGTRAPGPNRFLSEDTPDVILQNQQADPANYVSQNGYDQSFFESDDGPLLRPGA